MFSQEEPIPVILEDDDLEQVLAFFDKEPWVAILAIMGITAVVSGLLYVAFRGLRIASRSQPPVVVAVGVLGVVLLVSLITLTIRPDLGESLTVVIGSGIGALGSAVVASFEARRLGQQEDENRVGSIFEEDEAVAPPEAGSNGG